MKLGVGIGITARRAGRAAEMIVDSGFDDPAKWSASATAPGTAAVSGSQGSMVSPAGESVAIVMGGVGSGNTLAEVGRMYEFTLDIASYTGSAAVYFGGPNTVVIPAGTGIRRLIARADATFPGVKRLAACNLVLNSFSCKPLVIA